MRAPTLVVLALGLTASPLGHHACGRARRARRAAAAREAAAHEFHVPLGRPGTIRDAPIAWLYLPEDPVPTGSAPDVLVGLATPCGTHPVYGTVEGDPNRALAVRVRVQGRVPTGDATCAEAPPFVDYVSLARVRLGTVAVTDATAHAAGDPAAPSVVLHVVRDDATTPPPMLRRVRGCTPGDDATCTGGGVCATLAGRATGVCVPPLDPLLAASRPCAEGTVDVALGHTGALPPGPGPATAGEVHACLPACDADRPCTAPLACVDAGGGRSVCAP